jgi:hypothetical protein
MPKRNLLRSHVSIGLLAAGGIEVFVGSAGMITQSQAQQLLPEAQQLLPDSLTLNSQTRIASAGM